MWAYVRKFFMGPCMLHDVVTQFGDYVKLLQRQALLYGAWAKHPAAEYEISSCQQRHVNGHVTCI